MSTDQIGAGAPAQIAPTREAIAARLHDVTALAPAAPLDLRRIAAYALASTSACPDALLLTAQAIRSVVAWQVAGDADLINDQECRHTIQLAGILEREAPARGRGCPR